LANGFRRAHFLNIPEVSLHQESFAFAKADCKSKKQMHQIADASDFKSKD